MKIIKTIIVNVVDKPLSGIEIVMKVLENKNDVQKTLLNALKLRIAELKRSC